MADVSQLTLTVIRLGFLAVLWLFVLTAVSVMRSDLFGTRVAQKGAAGRGTTRPARPARPPKAPKPGKRKGSTLVVTRGTLAGTSIRLGETAVTIGRAQDCTVVLEDDYASGHHARLFPRDAGWWVEDLGSTNGTYLDRAKVTAPIAVPLGVPIRIGKTAFELRK